MTAMFTLVCFAMVYTTQDARAAVPSDHSMPRASLHDTVKASHQRAVDARQAVSQILTRPDVKAGLLQIGLTPEKLDKRIAQLSDQEIASLQQQLMPEGQQVKPAGLSTGAIVAIVCAGVAGMVILLWISMSAVDDVYDDY
jgi:hypothetical protein